MTAHITAAPLSITPGPPAHFGPGSVQRLPELLGEPATTIIVTDPALAASPVLDSVTQPLAARNLEFGVFSEVHANPTTDDVTAGAEFIAQARGAARTVIVAVGGGSSIDAAKGIALAAVNHERGRDLDYRRAFSHPALPIVAIPTTAGTGAETNAFGVVTDTSTHRKFYVGDASCLPGAVVLDPDLTLGLPPAVTAATGMDALTHALESYLSIRANPWSAGISLQVIRMISEYLPRACADGRDAEARAQMLLAAHMAGIGMASTGLGACHAIGHALGGRFGIPHGVALSLVLGPVLTFSLPLVRDRLADVAFAIGAGATEATAERNATAAIDAIANLAASVGMTRRLGDFGVRSADFGQIAADALADEVLVNAPVQPGADDITAILAAAWGGPVVEQRRR